MHAPPVSPSVGGSRFEGPNIGTRFDPPSEPGTARPSGGCLAAFNGSARSQRQDCSWTVLISGPDVRRSVATAMPRSTGRTTSQPIHWLPPLASPRRFGRANPRPLPLNLGSQIPVAMGQKAHFRPWAAHWRLSSSGGVIWTRACTRTRWPGSSLRSGQMRSAPTSLEATGDAMCTFRLPLAPRSSSSSHLLEVLRKPLEADGRRRHEQWN